MQDRELLFQLLAAKDWDKLSELIYEHRTILTSDPVFGHAVALFEQEFMGYIESLAAVDRVEKLRHISLIIESSSKSFGTPFVDAVIDEKLRSLHEIGSSAFAGYATQYQDRRIARDLLERTRTERPEHLAEARRPAVSVKAASAKRGHSSGVTSIFKSPQERSFYLAVRKAFPSLLPCPNVPLSTVIDFERVRGSIDSDERDYFFKAVFDCVVIDPDADYFPIYFFELDSKFHDAESVKRRDQHKNSICNAAGIKLVRIRALGGSNTSIDDFSELVVELMEKVHSSVSL